MSVFIAAQIIGFAAVCISISIFQSNKRSTMLKLVAAAAVLYAVQFCLLGAFTGAAMNIIGAARSYTFYKIRPSKRHQWILIVFIGLAIIGAIVTWQGVLSLLPTLGSICGGIAIWHKKPKQIRRWSLVASPLWFIYNAYSGSYAGMAIDVIMLSSNLLGEYRFDINHKSNMRKHLARPA
jgi:hypothetical protein